MLCCQQDKRCQADVCVIQVLGHNTAVLDLTGGAGCWDLTRLPGTGSEESTIGVLSGVG